MKALTEGQRIAHSAGMSALGDRLTQLLGQGRSDRRLLIKVTLN